MTNRRDFITRTTGILAAVALLPSQRLAARLIADIDLVTELDAELERLPAAGSPERLAEEESFWARVREAYALDPDMVNLDHGWSNPAPRRAVDELVHEARAVEALPAARLPSIWELTDTEVRAAFARAMGVPATEIALVRNATEALDTILLGVPLRAGDEVVCSSHDYFAMLDALEQRRARDGVVLRMLRPPVPAPSLDVIAALYEAAIGPRTRLVLLTHPSNLTGQLLPVRRIAAAAHRVGAEVVVDGAQSLGLLEDPVASLGCDYYGASAHKWLGCPIGLGVLWMRPTHTAKVWPLIPPTPGTTGMGRFEWIGTTPAFVEPGALPALTLHDSLGAARKAARLRYLTAHWRERAAAALPEARFYTLPDPAMSTGLCTVELPGTDPDLLQDRLRQRHSILVQALTDYPPGSQRRPEIHGLRVTPNVYTTPAELDRFVTALEAEIREVRRR